MTEPGFEGIGAIHLVEVVILGRSRAQRDHSRGNLVGLGSVVVALRLFDRGHARLDGGELRDDEDTFRIVTVDEDTEPRVPHDVAGRLVAIPCGHDFQYLIELIASERDDLDKVRVHSSMMHLAI